MGLSFKPEHLKRYKDIAWLLWKYGRSDLVKQICLERVLDDSRVELDPAEDNLAELWLMSESSRSRQILAIDVP